MHMRFKTVNSVIIVTLLLAITVMLVLGITYVNSSSYDTVLENQRQAMRQLASQVALSIDRYVKNNVNLAMSLAQQQMMKDALLTKDKGDAAAFIDKFLSNNKEYWAVSLIDTSGTIIAGRTQDGEKLAGKNRSSRDYCQAFLRGEDHFIGKSVLKSSTNENVYIFSFSAAVKDENGKILGGVGVFPKLEEFHGPGHRPAAHRRTRLCLYPGLDGSDSRPRHKQEAAVQTGWKKISSMRSSPGKPGKCITPSRAMTSS